MRTKCFKGIKEGTAAGAHGKDMEVLIPLRLFVAGNSGIVVHSGKEREKNAIDCRNGTYTLWVLYHSGPMSLLCKCTIKAS